MAYGKDKLFFIILSLHLVKILFFLVYSPFLHNGMLSHQFV